MTIAEQLKVLIEGLESRPLGEPELRYRSCRQRLPKAASLFIQRKIKVLKAEGIPIKRAVAVAYQMARRKGLL